MQAYLKGTNKIKLHLFCSIYSAHFSVYGLPICRPGLMAGIFFTTTTFKVCSLFLYRCLCVTGYTGPNCEVNINDCASSPCLNHATCVDALNSYVCKCPPGFTGSKCETGTQEQVSEKGGLTESLGRICTCWTDFIPLPQKADRVVGLWKAERSLCDCSINTYNCKQVAPYVLSHICMHFFSRVQV